MAATHGAEATRPGGGPAAGAGFAWLARRVARLLTPAAAALGGFASAEARVEAGLGVRLRPDVCVALGDPPYDGVLREPPVLVVVLADSRAVAAWLALGAEAVWVRTDGGARRYLGDGGQRALPPGGRLDVPGRHGLHLAVDDLHARPPADGAASLRSAEVVR